MNQEKTASNRLFSLPGLGAMFLAMVLTGFAVCIFVACDIGSDTLTVLLDGAHRVFNVSLGNGSRICNITILVIAILLNRKSVGLETVLYAFLIGYFIDFANPIVGMLSLGEQSIWIKLLAILVAQVLIALGAASMIHAGSGMHAVDAAAYGVVERFHVSYPFVRTMADVIFLVIGILLGGVAGWGTVIACLTTGLLISTFKKLLSKI